MDMGIGAEQIERVLNHLARLRQRGGQGDIDLLESLRPAWLGASAWDVVLEDLQAQRYRNPAGRATLRLVGP